MPSGPVSEGSDAAENRHRPHPQQRREMHRARVVGEQRIALPQDADELRQRGFPHRDFRCSRDSLQSVAISAATGRSFAVPTSFQWHDAESLMILHDLREALRQPAFRRPVLGTGTHGDLCRSARRARVRLARLDETG